MAPEFFLDTAIRGGFQLLPPAMDTPAARAMVLTVCLQESKLMFRRQVGGPAKGYAQFEQGGGVAGVLNHPSVSNYAKEVCAALNVAPAAVAVYAALEQNDSLTAAFARLLLWTLPEVLPSKSDPALGWSQYIAAWRPGKPHRETWDAYFRQAWACVEKASDLNRTVEVARIFLAGLHQLQLSVEDFLTKENKT